MIDIFISYASANREQARKIAEILENEGWIVWWDRTILPGQKFNEVIEEAINSAKCVMVLWSESSIKSDWVRDEAEVGRKRGILIPVLLENIEQPMGFRGVHFASLIEWDGTSKVPLNPLLTRLENILGKVPIAPHQPKTEEQPQSLKVNSAIGKLVTEEQKPSIIETIAEKKDDRKEIIPKSKKTLKSSLIVFAFLGGITIFTIIFSVMQGPDRNDYTQNTNDLNDTDQSDSTSSVPSTIETNKLIDVSKQTPSEKKDNPLLTKLSGSDIKTKLSMEPREKRKGLFYNSFLDDGLDSIKKHDFAKAVSKLQTALLIDSKDPYLWYLLGCAHEGNEQYADAMNSYDNVLKFDPDYDLAYYSKGMMLFYSYSDRIGALNVLKKLRDINPSFTSPSGESIQEIIDRVQGGR